MARAPCLVLCGTSSVSPAGSEAPLPRPQAPAVPSAASSPRSPGALVTLLRGTSLPSRGCPACRPLLGVPGLAWSSGHTPLAAPQGLPPAQPGVCPHPTPGPWPPLALGPLLWARMWPPGLTGEMGPCPSSVNPNAGSKVTCVSTLSGQLAWSFALNLKGPPNSSPVPGTHTRVGAAPRGLEPVYGASARSWGSGGSSKSWCLRRKSSHPVLIPGRQPAGAAHTPSTAAVTSTGTHAPSHTYGHALHRQPPPKTQSGPGHWGHCTCHHSGPVATGGRLRDQVFTDSWGAVLLTLCTETQTPMQGHTGVRAHSRSQGVLPVAGWEFFLLVSAASCPHPESKSLPRDPPQGLARLCE